MKGHLGVTNTYGSLRENWTSFLQKFFVAKVVVATILYYFGENKRSDDFCVISVFMFHTSVSGRFLALPFRFPLFSKSNPHITDGGSNLCIVR